MIKQIMLTVIILTVSAASQTTKPVITEKDYAVINYSNQLNIDGDIKKDVLFNGSQRKITQLTLNNGKSLGSHTVSMPFLVYCVAGEGELVLGENDKTIELKPGSMVTVEANIPHDVIGKPSLSIVVIRFLNDRGMD